MDRPPQKEHGTRNRKWHHGQRPPPYEKTKRCKTLPCPKLRLRAVISVVTPLFGLDIFASFGSPFWLVSHFSWRWCIWNYFLAISSTFWLIVQFYGRLLYFSGARITHRNQIWHFSYELLPNFWFSFHSGFLLGIFQPNTRITCK